MIKRIPFLLPIFFYCIIVPWTPPGNAEGRKIQKDFQEFFLLDETEIEYLIGKKEFLDEKSAKTRKEDHFQNGSSDKKHQSITTDEMGVSSGPEDKIPHTQPLPLPSSPSVEEPPDPLHLGHQLYPPLLFPEISVRENQPQTETKREKERQAEGHQLSIEEKEIPDFPIDNKSHNAITKEEFFFYSC